MIRKIQKLYALSEKGAWDLVKAVAWTAAANLTLMFSMGLLVLTLRNMIRGLQCGMNLLTGIVGIMAVGIILVAFIYFVHWMQYKALYIATYKESANRRIRLGEKLRELPLAFFGQRDLSDLTATMMSDCSSLEQTFSSFLPQLWGTVISTAVVAAGLLAMDWRMAIAILWVVPVAALLLVGSRRLQDSFGTKNFLSKRAATDGLQELLETVKDIKACNQKERYLSGFNEKLDQSERATVQSELITGTCITFAQAFLRLGFATTVLAGVHFLVDGSLGLTAFFVFLITASRIYDPLNIAFGNAAAVFDAQIRIRRMKEIEEEAIQRGTKECRPLNYDIVFDHVKFSYRDGEGVLEDVSFTAKQGEITALVGPSGGGKSTAARLAARFWDADSGRITLGGVDVSRVEPETLLENYAVVFQDVVLFGDTIMENIRLGRRGASDEEVLAAARAAQCDAFVHRLPEGYQTMIGENGATLSGGERQRISIARALLKDAPVILLDEATASLDVENETAVQTALSGLVQNKTVLVIAHRMRTVMGADKVVVLSDGTVAEMGSPQELMKKHGIFRRMVELQTESQSWVLPGET